MKLNRAISYTALGVIINHAIAVLFGAPFLSHFTATFVFSIVLAIVSIFPLLLVAENFDSLDIILFGERQLSHKCLLAHHLSLGGIFGAWFGAFVIPLDWDRWWQRWPLPCVFGTVFGGILGFLFSSYKIFLSRSERKLEKLI
uniref:Glycosylphosphatidylinositol anchor biosynthesis protein 11 n=1 Tax=Onchocerca volvulus TaxID=6282 RepID=A0A8R1TRI1_ONCVO